MLLYFIKSLTLVDEEETNEPSGKPTLANQYQVGNICNVEVKFTFVLLLIETTDDKQFS